MPEGLQGAPFAGALASAIHAVEPGDGDLVADTGEIVCGTCGRRRTMKIELFEGQPPVTVPVMCECDEKRVEAEMQRLNANAIRARLDSFEARGLYDRQYEPMTFSADDGRDAELSRKCRTYAERFDEFAADNIGLMLFGGLGCGKTYMAAAISNELLNKGKTVIMASIQTLAGQMQDDDGQTLRSVAGCSLLVLDDFGTERDTSYMGEKAYDIVNARYKAGKPLIVTTNVTPEQMRGETDTGKRRIYERIMEMTCPLAVKGGTRRIGMARNKIDRARELLAPKGEQNE